MIVLDLLLDPLLTCYRLFDNPAGAQKGFFAELGYVLMDFDKLYIYSHSWDTGNQ